AHAGGAGHRGLGSLERGHQLLEHGVIPGAVAAVDVAGLLALPHRLHHLHVLEHVDIGLVDGRREGAARGGKVAASPGGDSVELHGFAPPLPQTSGTASSGSRRGRPDGRRTCSRTDSASRRTPSSIWATGTAENDRRSARAPPPSTKKALPGVKVTPRLCARGRSAAASMPSGSVSSSEKPPRVSVQVTRAGMNRRRLSRKASRRRPYSLSARAWCRSSRRRWQKW